MSETMDDRDGWEKRIKEIHALVWLDDNEVTFLLPLPLDPLWLIVTELDKDQTSSFEWV